MTGFVVPGHTFALVARRDALNRTRGMTSVSSFRAVSQACCERDARPGDSDKTCQDSTGKI